MARTAALKRKAFFVHEEKLRRVRRLLGVETDAEAVRLAVDRVAEMEEFWRLMTKNRRALKPGSVRTP